MRLGFPESVTFTVWFFSCKMKTFRDLNNSFCMRDAPSVIYGYVNSQPGPKDLRRKKKGAVEGGPRFLHPSPVSWNYLHTPGVSKGTIDLVSLIRGSDPLFASCQLAKRFCCSDPWLPQDSQRKRSRVEARSYYSFHQVALWTLRVDALICNDLQWPPGMHHQTSPSLLLPWSDTVLRAFVFSPQPEEIHSGWL